MNKVDKIKKKITDSQIKLVEAATKMEMCRSRIGMFGNPTMEKQIKMYEAQIKNHKKDIDFNKRKLEKLSLTV